MQKKKKKTCIKLLNWISHSEFLWCISVVNQTCARNATLLYLSKKAPGLCKRTLYSTHKLFSSICICIVICILVDYREWRRRRCTKENYIPNQFQSYWWGVDMDFCSIFLLCFEVYCWDQWHTFQTVVWLIKEGNYV